MTQNPFPKRAAFIDRDGTVIRAIETQLPDRRMVERAPWNVHEVEFIKGTDRALSQLKDMGFLRILVTNQPDVGYGHIEYAEWHQIQNWVTKRYEFDDVFMCRHGRSSKCPNRKPRSGMLYAAADKHGISLAHSYMIGDTYKDMRAGETAGCTTILIDAPYNKRVKCDVRVKDLTGAAVYIALTMRQPPM